VAAFGSCSLVSDLRTTSAVTLEISAAQRPLTPLCEHGDYQIGVNGFHCKGVTTSRVPSELTQPAAVRLHG
jgi:hypothetical protein